MAELALNVGVALSAAVLPTGQCRVFGCTATPRALERCVLRAGRGDGGGISRGSGPQAPPEEIPGDSCATRARRRARRAVDRGPSCGASCGRAARRSHLRDIRELPRDGARDRDPRRDEGTEVAHAEGRNGGREATGQDGRRGPPGLRSRPHAEHDEPATGRAVAKLRPSETLSTASASPGRRAHPP